MPELAHLFISMIDDLLKEADERIGFGLDICNGENEIAEQVGTGCYITYEYNHSEEEVWRFVMLDDKEKAKLLAEEWASEVCTDDDELEYHKDWDFLVEQGSCTQAEFDEERKKHFAEFETNAAWDRKMRVGQNISSNTTVGYAFIYDFINNMPLEQLRQFTSCLFDFSIITGGLQDH